MNRRSFLRAAPLVALAGCVGGNRPTSTQRDATDAPAPGPGAAEGTSTTGPPPTTDATPTPVPADDGVFDSFESGIEWRVLDGSSTVTTDRCSGSTCLELQTGTDRSRLEREFDPPIDLRGSRLVTNLRAAKNCYPRFQLFDTAGNEIRFRTAVRGGLANQSFDYGIEAVEGNPDLSRIQTVRFMQSQSPTVWIDRIGFADRLPGTVAIMFDDGLATNYTKARPVLERYGYPATTFVKTGAVGNDDVLSLDQMAELQAAGWTVANHTVSHPRLPQLSRAQQRSELWSAKSWLRDHGFTKGARYVAYPFHEYTQGTLDLVDSTHRMGYAGGYPATGTLSNPLIAPRIPVDTAAQGRRAIDLAATYGGVTCLLYHRFPAESVQEFRDVVGYLHDRASAGDVDVATAWDIEQLHLPGGAA